MEYEWRLLHEDLDESDDDVDEKLQVYINSLLLFCTYVCKHDVHNNFNDTAFYCRYEDTEINSVVKCSSLSFSYIVTGRLFSR